MNEKVVFLFVLGLGAVRLYEDYMDEVDRDDDEEEDRFKKRKISRRDVGDGPIPPINTVETVVEVQQNRFSGKLLKSCGRIAPQNCSCSRLFCFGGYCQKLEKYHQRSNFNADSQEFPLLLTPGQPVWVKICRQTVLWGQNLCECRRYLSKWGLVKDDLTAFVNGECIYLLATFSACRIILLRVQLSTVSHYWKDKNRFVRKHCLLVCAFRNHCSSWIHGMKWLIDGMGWASWIYDPWLVLIRPCIRGKSPLLVFLSARITVGISAVVKMSWYKGDQTAYFDDESAGSTSAGCVACSFWGNKGLESSS
uniref:Expressed conserved protein n=1 Tax=Echinococcus granulosus TaxID=6210 RepID=A0A068WC81_ECHGR|nr:hypothetical protein EgrG_000846300 [Echinococcus granulosus]